MYIGETCEINGKTIQHGEGTQRWADGMKYTGNWQNGVKNGYGDQTMENS
jgi:hypothetical protein